MTAVFHLLVGNNKSNNPIGPSYMHTVTEPPMGKAATSPQSTQLGNGSASTSGEQERIPLRRLSQVQM